MYDNELYHHGIKGQKWGVRRFQNKDGSLTSQGKTRYDDGESYNRKHVDKKKIAKGVGIAAGITAATAATVYLSKHPEARKQLAKAGKAVGGEVKDMFTNDKMKALYKKTGQDLITDISDTTRKTGKAMLDAGAAAYAGIQITKITKAMDERTANDPGSEDQNEVAKAMITAGINSLAGVNNNSNNKGNNKGNNNGNNKVGSEITNKIGSPSNKGIDKGSSDYQNLFKDDNGNQRDNDTRSTIKSLASAGYDADQIRQYLKELDSGRIRHSDLTAISSVYIGKDIINRYMRG